MQTYSFKKPGIGAISTTLICLFLLTKLGLWQHQRLDWKTALLDTINTGVSTETVPLPQTIENPKSWDYRPVTVTGEFLHEQELYIQPRSFKDKAGGHILTPFKRASGDIVLINRGWIPKGSTDYNQPEGMLQITALVKTPFESGYFTPPNSPDKNQWYWIDKTGIEAHWSIETLPILLFETDKGDKQYPIGGQLRTDYPNDHFEYMIFWFSMIFVLVVVFILSHMTRTNQKDDA